MPARRLPAGMRPPQEGTMTPQERDLVRELFDRLATLESGPRDPDAEGAIAEGLGRAPHATYALVQTVLVQDEALKRAHARIEELEAPPAEEPPRSFLDNMRDSVFGREEPRGSVPRTGGLGSSGVWGQAGSPAAGGPPMGSPGMGGSPMGASPMGPAPVGTGGSSFLGTAAASAAGVIGGAMLLNGIRSMFGHSQGGSASAFDPGSAAAASPPTATSPARPASTTSATNGPAATGSRRATTTTAPGCSATIRMMTTTAASATTTTLILPATSTAATWTRRDGRGVTDGA